MITGLYETSLSSAVQAKLRLALASYSMGLSHKAYVLGLLATLHSVHLITFN